MKGMQHVGSKKSKDQLKQYFSASDLDFMSQRRINVTSVLDMK